MNGTTARAARVSSIVLAALVAAPLAAPFGAPFGIAAGFAADLPRHPDDLEFLPLAFEPPVRADYRHELPGGVPVYLAPSHEFPLITVIFAFKGGGYLESAEETGLGLALGSQLRRGGTATVPAAELDERFDFLAANVGSFVATELSGASINCLKSNFDEAFGLFMDMVRNPGFDAERLRVHRDGQIEQLRQRNDSPLSVTNINMVELVYGRDHYGGRQPTKATIEAITPERLRSLHSRIFHPGNLIIAATGDFEEAWMLEALAKALDGWERGESAGVPPSPTHAIAPGLYHANVAQKDLPQGTAVLVSRALRRDDPDFIAMEVMNDILGAGGFTSRIMNRVRSDEGLAYQAATFLQPHVWYPGIFAVFFQSQNRTVALATKICLEEVERMRSEPVSAEELEVARRSFIEEFPQRFASKENLLGVLVDDELTGRAPDFWHEYRDRVRAVSPEEVQRVARQYLHPEQMMILIVGDWDEIYEGDLEGRAKMSDFFGGAVKHLPMRDPLTLEPME